MGRTKMLEHLDRFAQSLTKVCKENCQELEAHKVAFKIELPFI